MNNFELFTMMYFVLDAIYDEFPEEKKNLPEDKWQDDLGMYLSEICPFTWESCDSADPAYFAEFSEFMGGKQIGDDYGYSLVCEYLEKENYYHNVLETFRTYKREDWIDACKRYISEPHKGDSAWQAEYEKKKRDEKNRKRRKWITSHSVRKKPCRPHLFQKCFCSRTGTPSLSKSRLIPSTV